MDGGAARIKNRLSGKHRVSGAGGRRRAQQGGQWRSAPKYWITRRYSLGGKPHWPRKKRVKWLWALKPRSPEMSDIVSTLAEIRLTAEFMRNMLA